MTSGNIARRVVLARLSSMESQPVTGGTVVEAPLAVDRARGGEVLLPGEFAFVAVGADLRVGGHRQRVVLGARYSPGTSVRHGPLTVSLATFETPHRRVPKEMKLVGLGLRPGLAVEFLNPMAEAASRIAAPVGGELALVAGYSSSVETSPQVETLALASLVAGLATLVTDELQ